MQIRPETIATLAPSRLANHRTTRYRADEQALSLSAFGAENERTIIALYAFLSELASATSIATGLRAGGGHDPPATLLTFLAGQDIAALLERVRGLRADGKDAHVAEALHDIRGGALTAIFVQLTRLGRVPYRAEVERALAIYARDHMKMMRNLVSDVDPPARMRDLAPLPHSLGDLARALAEFTANVGEDPVVVDVACNAEAVIADSCVECSAIDRVAYNYLNNAASHADEPRIEVQLSVLDSDLRVAVANSVSERQRTMLVELLAKDRNALFGSFTTSGSGHGLSIVSDLVGRAYGLPTTDALTEGGYIGTTIVDDRFVGWFHWPLCGA